MEQYKNRYGPAATMIGGKKWKGLFYGIIYGLAAKSIFIFALTSDVLIPASGITTLSFLFLIPFVMGLIVAWHQDSVKVSVFMALLAVSGLFGGSVLWQQESVLYALMTFPAYIVMATIGSITGRYIFSGKKNPSLLLAVVLAPFVSASIEPYFGTSETIYAQHTTININASEQRVWEHIVNVEAVAGTENKDALFRMAGFPQPLKATFDTVAVGGRRMAVFDRGLTFTEKITAAVPGQTLSFSIKADPGSTPLTTLEKHVIVDGKYFEVLKGKYELEKVNNQQVRLHLTATYRISTHFNFYCGWWARLIMEHIQKSILQVVKQNSETTNPVH
ncbi:MAG: SRPBCC family protein [Taibaiella sp.]|nr:SRPBCC family protein [Taibaiella sp.]